MKYGFIKILELEFGIYLKEHETEKIELAETCIEVYDSVEDFIRQQAGNGIIQKRQIWNIF